MEKVEMPKFFSDEKQRFFGAVIVAQLAERSLPISRGLRFESRHRQIFKEHLFTAKCIIEKTKIKEKEAELGPFLNIIGLL